MCCSGQMDESVNGIPTLVMGLDNFTSEDSRVEQDTTPTTGSSSSRTQDVGPRFAYHGFAPNTQVKSRSILYQIKSFNANWNVQFSTLRFERGELVLYTAGVNTTKHGKSVMVFTTIGEITADEPPSEELDIWVVLWDFNEQTDVGEGTYIEYAPDWNEELYEVIGQYLSRLDEYIDIDE